MGVDFNRCRFGGLNAGAFVREGVIYGYQAAPLDPMGAEDGLDQAVVGDQLWGVIGGWVGANETD